MHTATLMKAMGDKTCGQQMHGVSGPFGFGFPTHTFEDLQVHGFSAKDYLKEPQICSTLVG